MLKAIKTAVVIVLISCCVIACSSKVDSVDSHGKEIRLSDYKGKWVIVNYWATWCKPCIEEMPALQKLASDYKSKLVVLGVSFDKLNNDEINNFAKKVSVSYPLMSTFPIENYGIGHMAVLPVTFILNPQGKLVKTLKGPQTEQSFLKATDLV